MKQAIQIARALGLFLVILLGNFQVSGQLCHIQGIIQDNHHIPLKGVSIYIQDLKLYQISDSIGKFQFKNIPYGYHKLQITHLGKKAFYKNIYIQQEELILRINLKDSNQHLQNVTILIRKEKNFGRNTLRSVENFGIYEGRKSEVVEMSGVTANTSTNNARQVYAKITGLNIWESDGAGLQLGIGGRGLSPNRTANFNVRQNGYDISADALGYPESYYTPPLEAIERIELVRGAASLQYGTQFGGMLNFRFKRGPLDKKMEINSRLTAGSWGFFNSFNSFGGTVAKGKINYYTFFQRKQGNGFRPNSTYFLNQGFTGICYQVNSRLKLEFELTKMYYLAQQAGGLTDKQFEQNPRQSLRSRNWFEVDWNMASFILTYILHENTQINSRTFGLSAHRYALGNLERINVFDLGGNRSLISGKFQNMGNETRVLHKYHCLKRPHTLLIGTRVYLGNTTSQQGDANNGSEPDFYFVNPSDLENSDYTFHNKNFSAFIENIFNISDKWTLTPGIRYEYIGTYSNGYYTQRVLDGAGNLITQKKIPESMGRPRDFLIAGIGSNYKWHENLSCYANISQNYRAINFSDIRIVNPNFKVDPNIEDETGYTADLGFRAKKENIFNMELTGFYIRYNNKIGQILKSDQAPLYLDYRFRGNISDARNLGIEFFMEYNLLTHLKKLSQGINNIWTIYTNLAFVNAKYINTKDKSIEGKFVEMVPSWMLRTGSQYRHKKLRVSFQYSYISQHFTDATNAIRTSTAVEGIIPSYHVADLSASWQEKHWGIEGSINNLFNNMYFTRRAEAYPGPGIIPSDGRGFYLTLTGKW